MVASLVLPIALAALRPQVAPPPPAPPPAVAPRETPTFEKLHVDAAELPKEWKFESELACVSPQVGTLVRGGLYDQAVTPAARKDFQTIAAGELRGSILYFEYADAIPKDVTEFLPGLLWGTDGKPTRDHPERTLRVGSVLLILSFPDGSPQAAWFAERLRRRFGVRCVHDSGELKPLLQQLLNARQVEDAAGGLELLKKNASKLAAVSIASMLEGQFHGLKEEWAEAERAYARALELDATVDPLPDDVAAWWATDGRGTALYQLKRHEEAAAMFRQAAALVAPLGLKKEESSSSYNAVRCMALCGRSDGFEKLLARAIELDPRLKLHALSDPELASLKEDARFQSLTK